MLTHAHAFFKLVHLTPLRCVALIVGIVTAIFLSQTLAEVRAEFEAARRAQMPEPQKSK